MKKKFKKWQTSEKNEKKRGKSHKLVKKKCQTWRKSCKKWQTSEKSD